MNDLVGRAEYEISVPLKEYFRDLDKAERGTDKRTKRMERSVDRVGLSFGKVAKRAGVALAATTALGAGFLLLVKNALAAAETIGDMANRANTTAEQLQELRFAVNQNGGEFRDADDALVRLNRRLSIFVATGGGPGALAFKELGINARDASGNIRNSSDVFDEIARKIANLEDASKAAALASAAFGEDAGPRLVPLLRQGEEGIRAAREEARRLGLVLDNDTVAAASEASAKLRALGQVISTGLTNALVQAAPLITDLADRMFRSLPTIIAWIDRIGQAIGLLNAPASERLAENNARIQELNDLVARDPGSVRGGLTYAGQLAEKELTELRQANRDLADEIANRQHRLEQLQNAGRIRDRTLPNPPGAGGSRGSGSGGSRRSAALSQDARAAEQASQAFARLTAQLADLRLQRQRDIELSRLTELGAARVRAAHEQEAAATRALEAAIRSQGAVSEEELARVIALTKEIEKLAVAKAEAAAQSRQREDAEQQEAEQVRILTSDAKTLTRAIFDAATASESWQEAILKIALAILELESVQNVLADVLTSVLNIGGRSGGGGLLGSILGGVFGAIGGGGKAGGTTVKAFRDGGQPPVGRFSIVGEEGPELRYFGRASTILDASKTADMMSGGAGIYAPMTNNIYGASEEAIMARMEPRLQRHRQTILGDVSTLSGSNPEFIE
jgi:hypothetical protein